MLNSPLQLFDSLDLPLVLFDAQAAPISVTTSAARLLHIQRRDQLDQYADILEPLSSLADSVVRARAPISQEQPPSLSKELTLMTADRRMCAVIAEAIVVEGLIGSSTPGENTAVVVRLYNLSAMEPLVEALDSIRRMRPFLLSHACQSGISLGDLMAMESGMPSAQNALEEEIANGDEMIGSDLLRILSESIDLVDPLLPPGVKISTDTRNSVLLDASPGKLRQVVGQLLLEAADFASPSGTVSIQSQLPTPSRGASAEDRIDTSMARLVFHSRRSPEQARSLDQVERYLYRRVFPHRYKATLGGSRQAAASTQVETTLADESRSDSLKLAERTAKSEGMHLETRRIRGDLLALHVHIPLVRSKAPGSPEPTNNSQ